MSTALLTGLAAADGPALGFRVHAIDPSSEFVSCAVMDVDRDGRLDVVSGGWWHQAPNWKRHKVREVEIIRGRFDDYSNLPFDVNGDGRMDLISANYRSTKLAWIEQPANPFDLWKEHVVATPGPMETARLVDIDGDTKFDILPNGANFAAWWEMAPRSAPRSASGDQPATFEFIRHDLPQELAAHGIGFGDINGDGRGDIVGPRGWAEAPADRKQGRWVFHADFELHRDCSVPILIYDVDEDGDSDIVYGRGHSPGVYWVEQIGADEKARSSLTGSLQKWVRHAIDTSTAQNHSPLLADLDGDGKPELVTGKRYMGHEGRDLGEYDVLGVHWYRFDPAPRTWTRGVVSDGGRGGWGLDPKAADLDGDGDTDLVSADRSGLFWYENLLRNPGETAPAPAEPVAYPDHSKLLVVRDSAGAERPVKTPFDWGERRRHVLDLMQTVMGPLADPSRRIPLDVQVDESVDFPRYVRKRISYQAEPVDRVPAYLLIPKGIGKKSPAMLCLHQTVMIGKGEPVGLGGRVTLRYGQELAERGYICLCPDYPSFGDYKYDFAANRGRYPSGSMKAIWNNIRGLDLLESMPEVDPDRIGCIGHSLGGHNAMFTAAFDLRIRVIVSSCGFTAFHHYYGGKLAGWTSDRYMPRIRDIYQNNPDKVPFDFYEIVGSIAPRAFFANAPISDSNFDVEGVRKVEAAARDIYKLHQAGDKLKIEYPDSEHDFPDAVRMKAYAFIDQWLKRE